MSTPTEIWYKQYTEDRAQRIDQAAAYRELYRVSSFGLPDSARKRQADMFSYWARAEKSGALRKVDAFTLIHNYEHRYGFPHSVYNWRTGELE